MPADQIEAHRRAADDRGWCSPEALAVPIMRLAITHGFYHGGRTEGHGGPRESERRVMAGDLTERDLVVP